ncbi:MAG TPA: aldo/keto reductase [Planctomycetaceae bacterium]|nr:aldo/keto reductase [Planctomycetaceae bacterium]
MEKRRLGNTDLELTTIGLGTWAIGGGDWKFGWGPQDEQEAVEAVLAAVRHGINWIDTAAVYGGGVAETLVGKALAMLPVSERPIVATKCGRVMRGPEQIDKVLKRESIFEECDASLKRLGVDAIDLYQLHWPEPDEDIEEGWAALVELKQQGKVREIGVSNHNVAQLKRLEAIHPVASLQPPYSLLKREAEKELLPYCAQQDIGVVCYSPMYKGLLTGKFTAESLAKLDSSDHRTRDIEFQSPLIEAHLGLVDCLRSVADSAGRSLAELAIAWVLRRPEVTSAIVGSRRPDQVAQTVSAADWKLSQPQIETITQLLAGHAQAMRMGALG